MTTLIEAPANHQVKLANMLIAAGGDIKLVCEHLNRALPPGVPEVQETEVLQAFLDQASQADTQSSIKALLLLNLLEMLTAAKSHLASAMPEFSPVELLRTVQLVIEGIGSLLPAPTAAPATTQVNFLQQFGADAARSKVEARLETYQKLDQAYPPDQTPAVPTRPQDILD